MESPSARVGPGLGIRTGNVDSDRWRPRRCKAVSFVVASSSSSSSSEREEPSERSSSFLSRIQTYALLKQQLAVAAKFEDYREAARIRDSLKSFEDEEPVLRLRRLMKQAIKEERFENKLNWMLIGSSYWPLPIAIPCWMVVDSYQDAACHRDELRLVAPQSLLKCSSDATTLGIRVQIRSVYIADRSQPSRGQYLFAYRIRITNNSDRPAQVLRRHWIVTNANGKSENIWGVGVIGEQPVIRPGTSFEYSSMCPLATPNGRMEGDFEMKHNDRVGSLTFNVAIAPLCLAILGDDDDIM